MVNMHRDCPLLVESLTLADPEAGDESGGSLYYQPPTPLTKVPAGEMLFIDKLSSTLIPVALGFVPPSNGHSPR